MLKLPWLVPVGHTRLCRLLSVRVLTPKLNDMWYFLEKDGHAIAKAKVQMSIKLKYVEKVRAGVDPSRLRITDICGRTYPNPTPPCIEPFLPKPRK